MGSLHHILIVLLVMYQSNRSLNISNGHTPGIWLIHYANTKLPRFYLRFYSPNTLGADALSHSWEGGNRWLVPPVCLVCQVQVRWRACGPLLLFATFFHALLMKIVLSVVVIIVFSVRPRLYGEKLSRVEGWPAYPSYPGRANFSYISEGGVRVRGDAVLRCFWCGFSGFF